MRVRSAQSKYRIAGNSARRGSRRSRRWILTLGILAVLIVSAAVWAENGARTFAQSLVRDQIVSVLKLPQDSKPLVDLGAGSLLSQAVSGRISSLAVSVDTVPLGTLTGDLRIFATGIPLDPSQPLTRIAVSLALSEGELHPLGALLGNVPIESIVLKESQIVVSTAGTLYGSAVPVTVSFTPSVSNGHLVLSATDLSVGGKQVSLTAAAHGPLSALVKPLINPPPLCLANVLPRAVTLDTAQVVEKSLVLGFSAAEVVLSDGSLTTVGTCP